MRGEKMKRENLFWIVILILAAGLVMSWFFLFEMRKESKAVAQKTQRAVDYMEIQNVFAKHSYYYAAQKQWLELDTVWAKKRDDISYGHNNGYYYGRKSVENYYGKKNEDRRKQWLEMVSKIYPEVKNTEENLGVGDLVLHTLTTPDIEVADDGQTAQGVWISIGLAGKTGQDGKVQYNWFWEKFGVDFVKEDGEWKIWHFQIHSDTMFILPESMTGGMPPGMSSSGGPQGGAAGQVQSQGGTASKAGQAQPQGAGAPGAGQTSQSGPTAGGGQPQGMKNDMDKIVEMYKTYSATTVPQLVPKMPAPYKTWSDTTPYIKE
jgi:hypothetical protein